MHHNHDVDEVITISSMIYGNHGNPIIDVIDDNPIIDVIDDNNNDNNNDNPIQDAFEYVDEARRRGQIQRRINKTGIDNKHDKNLDNIIDNSGRRRSKRLKNKKVKPQDIPEQEIVKVPPLPKRLSRRHGELPEQMSDEPEQDIVKVPALPTYKRRSRRRH